MRHVRQKGGEQGEQDSNRRTPKHLDGFRSRADIHDGIHKDGEEIQDGNELEVMDLGERLRTAQSSTEPHACGAPDDSDARDLRPSSITLTSGQHGRQQHDRRGILSHLARLDPCSAVVDYIELLRSGPLDPPVTTDSLRELDLPLIKNNLGLRIDVNYDHDLHFMPISGRRGDEKREEAQKYWQCIVLELRVYQHDALGTCHECNRRKASTLVSFPSRLPRMFRHMKALILLLVPDDDHQRVQDAFDVDLLVQEMQNGVLDAGGLAVWLKSLLTTHCAPIRDDKAEEMARIISRAATEGMMQDLVLGLEKLFAFLECMRLDVANHQIRTYRVPLIEDGIAFQIDYFEARIQQRKLSVDGSRQWFLNLHNESREKEGHAVHGRDVLACGLTKLCTSDTTQLPVTLKHDESRLHVIQQELRDEVHLRVCRKVYKSIILELLRAQPNSPSLSRQNCPSIDMHFSTSRIIDLTEPSDADQHQHAHFNDPDTWHTHIDSIALDIAHQAFRAADRTSASITADFSAYVRRVLQKGFEDEYRGHEQARFLEREVQERVLEHAATFDALGALEIAEQQKAWQLARVGAFGGSGSGARGEGCVRMAPDLEDVARRLAHVTVVHWRVWRGWLTWLSMRRCRMEGWRAWRMALGWERSRGEELMGSDEGVVLAELWCGEVFK